MRRSEQAAAAAEPGDAADAPARPQRPARMAPGRAMLRLGFELLRPKRLYEPVEIGGRRYPGKRDADERWNAIAATIKAYGAASLLDIGCAEGWFLRRAAEDFGCLALGIDGDQRRVILGEVARLHDGVEGAAIMQANLTPDSIGKLPKFDMVLCLSVVHHVIRRGGIDAAREFTRALATRAERVVLFEMGTSDEKALPWSAELPDMAGGQEAFVRSFLQSCGLTNVRTVASTLGLKGDASRLLFAAEPARS